MRSTNWHDAKQNMLICELGNGQYKAKLNSLMGKHIYIIPANNTYHYLSSIVIILQNKRYIVVPINSISTL